MKKYFLSFATLVVVAMLGLTACENNPNNRRDKDDDGDGTGNNKEVITTELSPEDNKEKLMKIAKSLLGKFNTADQKATIEMADDLYNKYEHYSWEDLGDYFENKYEPIFALPRYAANVAAGRKSPAYILSSVPYTFSFANDKAIFEANESTHSWEYKGVPNEDCVILRCTDSKGKKCEAKVWSSGSTKTISYTYEDSERHEEHTISGVMPEKVYFTLTQDQKEHIRFELTQNIDEKKLNDVAIAVTAKVSNLKWTMDVNFHPTNGSCAYAIFYGNDKLISAAVNLPSYQLIAKGNSQSYEDWINEYSNRYEELIRNIGSADAIVDVMESVQIKGKITNFGNAYDEFMYIDNNLYGNERDQAYCNLMNNYLENGLYYNSDTKQAEVRMQMTQDNYEGYYMEPVLYFEEDHSTYAFEQYFDRNFYSELMQMAEDLINKYIRLSDRLYNEIGGEIHFN